MYRNDPFEVVQPRKIQPAPKIDPRFLAFGSEAQRAGRGHTVGKPERTLMVRNVCLYFNGRHACYDQSDYCPAADPRVYTQQQEQPIVFRPTRPRQ